jgi:hypothetical protein
MDGLRRASRAAAICCSGESGARPFEGLHRPAWAAATIDGRYPAGNPRAACHGHRRVRRRGGAGVSASRRPEDGHVGERTVGGSAPDRGAERSRQPGRSAGARGQRRDCLASPSCSGLGCTRTATMDRRRGYHAPVRHRVMRDCRIGDLHTVWVPLHAESGVRANRDRPGKYGEGGRGPGRDRSYSAYGVTARAAAWLSASPSP